MCRQQASLLHYLPTFRTFRVGAVGFDFLFDNTLSPRSTCLGRISNKSLSSITTPPTILRSSCSVWCTGTNRLRCQPRIAKIFLNCMRGRSQTITNSRPWSSSSMKPLRCMLLTWNPPEGRPPWGSAHPTNSLNTYVVRINTAVARRRGTNPLYARPVPGQ